MIYGLDNTIRPAFTINGMQILLDTGAVISVFTGKEKDVQTYFPTAKRFKLDAIMSGFNSGIKVYSAYIVDKYSLGDIDISNLIFIVVEDCTDSCDFILAGTVLNSTEYTINHRKRFIDIKAKNNSIVCGIQYIDYNGTTYIDGTYSLYQNRVNNNPFRSSINKMSGD